MVVPSAVPGTWADPSRFTTVGSSDYLMDEHGPHHTNHTTTRAGPPTPVEVRTRASASGKRFRRVTRDVFEGAEPLFRDLAIHDRWDWSVRHPVVRLSFGGGNFKDPDYLAANLAAQLDDLERRARVPVRVQGGEVGPGPGRRPDPPDGGDDCSCANGAAPTNTARPGRCI